MAGDPAMVRVAAQRSLAEKDLTRQVLGFWVQGICSDLALGSTAAMKQNLEWLIGFREGHDLPFDNALVARTFSELSVEIETRLGTDDARRIWGAYRDDVHALIATDFPT
jgi:hypothetical protein